MTAELDVIADMVPAGARVTIDLHAANRDPLAFDVPPPSILRPSPEVSMHVTTLTTLDYVVMAIYFAVVLGIGWALRRMMRTSTGSISVTKIAQKNRFRNGKRK